MRHGFVIPVGDVLEIVDLTIEAEAAGWDAAFIADAIDIGMGKGPPMPWFDPWVALGAMAMRTERIRIGTMIAAVPRRRPWKLAREAATIDHLSAGRLTLGVGLGAAEDGGFFKVGEPVDLKVRAQILDEALAIMDGLWSGKKISFKGEHYRVDKMAMLPRPVQQPRIPVWVVGVWPKEKSMARAIQWDGIIPQKYKAAPGDNATPDDIRAMSKWVQEHRGGNKPFDIIAAGMTDGKSRKRATDVVRPFADAGATWWLESVWSMSPDKIRGRIKQGPPQI